MPEERSKIGFQCQFDSKAAALYNRLLLPTAWMSINVVKPEFLQRMVDDNPEAHRIFRHYPNRPWAEDPERQAREAVAHIAQMMFHARAFFTHVIDNNEFILGLGHASAELIARADRYMSTFVRVAWDELGMGVCAGNFNTGHWGDDTVLYFPLTLQAIEEHNVAHPERPCFMAWHEYNWPLFRDDEHWHTGKFLRAMPPILEQYPHVLGILTEVGIDRPSREWGAPHEGWRKAHPDFQTAVDWYCGDQGLFWLNEKLNECDYMVAALIFGCGMGDPWRPAGFDIMHDENDRAVLDRIKLYPGWIPPEPPPPEPPPPEPPNGGNMDGIRVFKLHDDGGGHTEVFDQEAEALVFGKYGARFRRADVAPGQKVFRLVELWEKSGHHSLISKVVDEDDNPLANTDVAFYWPDAPDPPDPPTEVYDHDWYRRFKHGKTGGNGDVGPGMGGGAWMDVLPYPPHDVVEGGPHAVWVRDPEIPSDICEKLGMRGGTNHDHLDQKFRRMDAGGNGEPPPPGKGKFAETFRRFDHTEGTNGIQIELQGEDTEKINFYDTQIHLVIGEDPNAPDYVFDEPFSPETLILYRISTQYNPTPGEEGRTFWATIQTLTGEALSDPMPFGYRTNEYGIHQITVEWQAEDQPPPPPDDRLLALAELFDRIGDLFQECATILRG